MSELQKAIDKTERHIRMDKHDIQVLEEKIRIHDGVGEKELLKTQRSLSSLNIDLQTLQAIKAEQKKRERKLITENYALGREDERKLSENPAHKKAIEGLKNE